MSKITEACGLGNAIHSAFREATDCEQAPKIWQLIFDMPDQDWRAVLEFIYECLPVRVQGAMEQEEMARRVPQVLP